MKNNSIKILIAILAVAIVGGGVYFANTKQQQGSFTLIKGRETCPVSPQLIFDSSSNKFNGDYNSLFSTMQGNTVCNYLFEGESTNNNEPYSSLFSCSKSEIKFESYEPTSTTKRINCKKDNMQFGLDNSSNFRTGNVSFFYFDGKVVSKNFFSKVRVYKVDPSYRQGF